MYYKYKGYSPVIMTIADSDYRFIYVNVGSYGKDCDFSIFKNCKLWKSVLNREQELPDATFFQGMSNKKVPARRVVECTFGILTNKCRIFHRAINFKPDFAVDIVKACVVLHNFVRERDGYEIEKTFTVTGLADLPGAAVVREGTAANDVRNIFADITLCQKLDQSVGKSQKFDNIY
nr:unnamed protein product [Callosobruchus analis]